MSKTLSKVLVICALVVILPLTIVGTAFAAYYSVDNVAKISVLLLNDKKAVGDDYYAMIDYNGEKTSQVEIKTGHTKTVSVSAAYTNNAYNFIGWFNGTDAEYKSAGAEAEVLVKPELKIDMEDGGNWLAVYQVVEYNVVLNYQTNPEDEASATTDEKAYVYGAALPTQADISSYEGEGYVYTGWKASNGETYTHATFAKSAIGENNTVNLSNPWTENEKITITYKLGSQVATEEIWKHETKAHTLAKIETGMFASDGWNFEMTSGYNYYWWYVDADGNGSKMTTVGRQADITVELRGEAINYNVNLANLDDVKENSVSAVTLNVDDTPNFDSWLNLTPKYSFWTITGIDYKGTTYSKVHSYEFDVLRDQYIQDATNGTAGEFALHVDKNYATFTHDVINFKAANKASAIATAYSIDVYAANDAKIYVDGIRTPNPKAISGVDAADAKDSANTIEEFLGLNNLGTGDYSAAAYYAVLNNNGTKTAQALKFYGFMYTRTDGSKGIIKFVETDTINDVLEKIIAANGDQEDKTIFAINGLTALFVVAE